MGIPARADKLLIVNADDFGLTPGINDGIRRAHLDGIVTSASLMVDRPGSADAARSLTGLPRLGVGIHVALTEESTAPVMDFEDASGVQREIERQVERFVALTKRTPSHVDSHHHVHRDPRLAPLFQEAAAALDVPLRDHSAAAHCGTFYGVWDDGLSHPEWIAYENLARLLAEEVEGPVTELGCHPGFPEIDFVSDYASERALEVETLCDARLPDLLRELGFRLVDFRALERSPA